MKKSKPYQPDLIESLRDAGEAEEYLNAALEEDDPELFLLALRNVAEAQGGVAQLAEKTKLNRESLYKMLSERGKRYADEAIAALLHDAVEDQGGRETAKEIERRFGARVVEIVLDCSDTDEHPKPPWRERKESYIAHMEDTSESARLIIAADKLDNARCLTESLRAMGDEIWRRFGGGREGTLWYYRSVRRALEALFPGPLTDELERAIVGPADRKNLVCGFASRSRNPSLSNT